MLSFSPAGGRELEETPAFNVVIAYEDLDTGRQAKRTYDFLVENLGRDCEFISQMWKFEVLAVAKLREMARLDAVKADIIIVSCHGSNALPDHVKEWIETWAVEQSEAMALVALFESGSEEQDQFRATRDYLMGIANRGKMGFFVQSGKWSAPEMEKEAKPADADEGPAGRAFNPLGGAAQRDVTFPRWGINE